MDHKKWREQFPKLDFEKMASDYDKLTDADIDRICAEIESAPTQNWRQCLRDWEANPNATVLWDIDMSIDEFKRRIEAGELD